MIYDWYKKPVAGLNNKKQIYQQVKSNFGSAKLASFLKRSNELKMNCSWRLNGTSFQKIKTFSLSYENKFFMDIMNYYERPSEQSDPVRKKAYINNHKRP